MNPVKTLWANYGAVVFSEFSGEKLPRDIERCTITYPNGAAVRKSYLNRHELYQLAIRYDLPDVEAGWQSWWKPVWSENMHIYVNLRHKWLGVYSIAFCIFQCPQIY